MTAGGAQAGTPSKAKYSIDPGALAEGKSRVRKLLSDFPVYPNLDLALLEKHFSAA
jgi:glycine hydroxymethyltransferase